MKWTGKIVGSLIGLMLGRPIAVVLGFIIGHLYDIGLFSKLLGLQSHGHHHARVQEVFFNNTFTIMGHLAKCDGRVSENEIRIAQNVMQEMNLNPTMKREAIRLFNEGKLSNFALDAALRQLRGVCWNRPSLLRIFIEIQLKIAFADGQEISSAKQQTLHYICQQLGVGGFNFSQFEQRYRAEQNYQHSRSHYQSPNPEAHLSDAYKVLGVTATSTDAEVKKAYRRLMSQNHPDKLMAKGLPPEMIKMATQKTQQIKKAYEQISAARSSK